MVHENLLVKLSFSRNMLAVTVGSGAKTIWASVILRLCFPPQSIAAVVPESLNSSPNPQQMFEKEWLKIQKGEEICWIFLCFKKVCNNKNHLQSHFLFFPIIARKDVYLSFLLKMKLLNYHSHVMQFIH